MLLAAGDPEEVVGLLGTEAVCSAYRVKFINRSGSRFRFTMGSRSRYGSEPCSLLQVVLEGL